MKKNICLVLSCILSLFVLIDVTFFLGPVIAAELNIELLSSTVAYLQTVEIEKIEFNDKHYEIHLKPVNGGPMIPKIRVLSGTGFFVSYNNRLFLVTAEHIAMSTNTTTFVTIRSKDDRPLKFSIKDFYGKEGELEWIVHGTADVALLPLDPKAKVRDHLSKHFLSKEIFPVELEAPGRDMILTILGFPRGFGVRERFSPLSIETKPASGLITYRRFDTQKEAIFFFLDRPGIGGLSGAPVFLLPRLYLRSYEGGAAMVKSKTSKCVGIVHGTISDQTGGKMAAIHPAKFVLETLQRANDVLGLK